MSISQFPAFYLVVSGKKRNFAAKLDVELNELRMKQEMAFKKDRDAVIAKADGRGVWENLKNYDMDSFSMHRSYEKPEA